MIKDRFDLIWVGSLLTHLDDYKWVEFLELFISVLSPNGLLVFTTHGRRPADWIRTGISPNGMTRNQLYGLDPQQSENILKAYDANGFGYVNYRSQKDYGISLASPSWALSRIEKFPNVKLVAYVEYGWDNHQDVIAVLNSGSATPPQTSARAA